jgi:hypothetical protein
VVSDDSDRNFDGNGPRTGVVMIPIEILMEMVSEQMLSTAVLNHK